MIQISTLFLLKTQRENYITVERTQKTYFWRFASVFVKKCNKSSDEFMYGMHQNLYYIDNPTFIAFYTNTDVKRQNFVFGFVQQWCSSLCAPSSLSWKFQTSTRPVSPPKWCFSKLISTSFFLFFYWCKNFRLIFPNWSINLQNE